MPLQEFWKGYCKSLKQQGHGDTENHEEIVPEDLEKIHEFLALLQSIIETEKDTDRYWELVYKLPRQYRDIYHYHLQWSLQYIIMASTAKRGREGKYEFEYSLLIVKY